MSTDGWTPEQRLALAIAWNQGARAGLKMAHTYAMQRNPYTTDPRRTEAAETPRSTDEQD